jgi:hypothetical protein
VIDTFSKRETLNYDTPIKVTERKSEVDAKEKEGALGRKGQVEC